MSTQTVVVCMPSFNNCAIYQTLNLHSVLDLDGFDSFELKSALCNKPMVFSKMKHDDLMTIDWDGNKFIITRTRNGKFIEMFN